jgi:hypothetical protein
MITFNNGIGHRGRKHINLLCHDQIILKFEGKSIPGVVRVLSENYTKQGKWSQSRWEIELAPGFTAFEHHQDWESGDWFPARTWDRLVEDFNSTSGLSLAREVVERYVRAEHPEVATALDDEEEAFNTPFNSLAALIEAQAKKANKK